MSFTTLPPLYQKTNTGAIQRWYIEVAKEDEGAGLIATTWGQVDGKQQHTVDTIREGKNPGKRNATTPYEQACLEAKAKWTKQLKKGYVQTLEEAEAGTVDAIIEGGIEVMLAPSKIYPTFAHKLTWPVYTQRKYDGSRCVATIKDGVCTLWTRTRKQIHSVPHIVKALEERFRGGDIILDGELYNAEYRDNFEDLMSLIRPDSPREGHEVVQYHVYDLPSWDADFGERSKQLGKLLEGAQHPIVLVGTDVAVDHDAVMAFHERNLAEGFEGTMVRNDGPYQGGKRSTHLQKLKNFVDNEYPVIGIEEGRGKDAGTVGAFVCATPEGKEFKARLKATYERRRELFNDHGQWKGQLLTVAYQNLTSDGLPRFPIGKSLRNYE